MLWGPTHTHTHTHTQQQQQQQLMHAASVRLHYTTSTQNALGNCLNCAAANNAVLTIHLNPSRCVFYLHWHHSHQPARFTSNTEKLLNLKTWGLVLDQHPSSHLVSVHVWLLAVHWLFARSYPGALVHVSAANNLIIICTVSILKITLFCCMSALLLVQLNSTPDLGLQAVTSSHRVRREEREGKKTRLLTKFSTVSTISRLLTSPTWISPMRTANFILIFRIGTDGLIIPAGRTTEPEPDIIIVSPAAAAETAAACCLWPGGGCRSESDTEPGIVTGLSLVMSTQTGRLFGRG